MKLLTIVLTIILAIVGIGLYLYTLPINWEEGLNQEGKDIRVVDDIKVIDYVEEICEDKDMEYLEGSFLQRSGCVDKFGEIHYYAFHKEKAP